MSNTTANRLAVLIMRDDPSLTMVEVLAVARRLMVLGVTPENYGK